MKKRVAFFAESLYGGGVERILQTILLNFDYEKYDVTLYSARPEMLREGFYPIQLRHYHYFDKGEDGLINKVKSIVKNKIKLWVYYHCSPRLFYKMFIREEYDIAVAFIEGYATRIVSGASEQTRKLSWLHIELESFHWTDVAYRNRLEEQYCYNKMYKIPCVSQIVKEQADSLFGLRLKTEIIYNPIDAEMIRFLSQAFLLKRNTNRVRILSIGSLHKRKAHDRMLRIAKRMKMEGYIFELLILGKGSEEYNLKEYIEENDLIDCVKMLGYKDNPYPYLASSDFYVCSSFAEGYNTAVSESLILGIPVVSTEVSGIREQLGANGEYGIITENDEQSLYEGVIMMMKSSVRQKYKVKAMERGKDFSIANSMTKIYRLFEE